MSRWMRGAALGAIAATVVLTATLAASTQAASLAPATKVSVSPGSAVGAHTSPSASGSRWRLGPSAR